MRKLLYIVLSFLLLSSCAGQRRHDAALRHAQAILNDAPDSALTLLDSMEAFSSEFSRGTLMRWQLLRLSAQNKCDTVFRSDSLQLVLTNYFDRHGTPNERMMAHYLLGRAYYDMDNPMGALAEFQFAVSSADTTSADCDYWNLTRAYLNQLYVLYAQNLGREILSVLGDASHAARKASDTPSFILCYEYRAMAYECLGMPDSMCMAGLVASSLYRDEGLEEMAARALAWSIPYQIDHGDYNIARKNIETYESHSGYFDSEGNIEPGREHYYAVKGNYYLGVCQLDSAEHYFRRCLAVRKTSEKDDPMRKTYNCWHAGSKGLSNLFTLQNIVDSVAKYARFSEIYNDSLHARGYLLEALRMNKLYDYTEHLKVEDRLREDVGVKGNQVIFLGSFVLVLLMAGIGAVYYHYIEKRRYEEKLKSLRSKEEMLSILQEIRNSQASQSHIQYEFPDSRLEDCLKRNMESNIRQIDLMIQRQKEEMSELLRKTITKWPVKQDDILSDMDFREFVVMAKQHKAQFDKDNWAQLNELFTEKLPEFLYFLQSNEDLNVNEFRICLLVRLGLNPTTIAELTGNSRSNVSMIRTRIYKKLTGNEGNGKDLERYLRSLWYYKSH